MEVKDWLGENEICTDIWDKKYRYNNETFDEFLDRISNKDMELRNLIKDKKFLFGGRILANRGLHKDGRKITYSNCYVLSQPEDNIESIFDTAKKLARTYSYGGGVGVDLSKLAPRGAKINNAAKSTTGSVSFMDLYSLVTGLIGQEGRRGALMLSLDCSHPDLEEFIGVKEDLDKVTKANISIKITKDFMDCVKKDTDYVLSFTRENTGETIEKTVKAREIFMKLATMNWRMAEPGVLFWDRIKDWTLLSNHPEFEFAGTNPCAEEPLPAGGSCLLGSINLAEFVVDGTFDALSFANAVHIAVRALNDVLDEGLPLHPLEEQRNSVRDWRQIGLGIMGAGDMLIKLGLRYGSKEAIDFCDDIGFIMANESIKASALLAKEHGAYPKCRKDLILETPFFKKNTTKEVAELVEKYGLRNSQLLTIAPTGSLSTMLGITGGVEPIYNFGYERKTESLHGKDVKYMIYTPIVKEYMDKHGITSEKDLPDFFVTAMTLNYKDRINMQGIWQDHIDASISSTVNVPEDFTVEDTFDLYMSAYDRGLKGCTIFRDNCERIGILTNTEPVKIEITPEQKTTERKLERGDILQVSDNVVGKKRRLTTGCGTLHCQAYFDEDGNMMETFFSKGSTGGCNNFMISLSRMISYALRIGGRVEDIKDQLDSCGTCPSYSVRHATKKDTSKGSSCPVAIGNALLDMYKDYNNDIGDFENDYEPTVAKPFTPKIVIPQKPSVVAKKNSNPCPSCGEELAFGGGCNSCPSCGWSKCDL